MCNSYVFNENSCEDQKDISKLKILATLKLINNNGFTFLEFCYYYIYIVNFIANKTLTG